MSPIHRARRSGEVTPETDPAVLLGQRVELGGQRVGVAEQRPGRLDPGLGHHHVARARGEHVRDVEPALAAHHGRDPLLQQQALDQLGLGLVSRPGDLDGGALRVLGADLPGVGVRVVARRLLALARVDEGHAAGGAEALVEAVVEAAARADEAHPTLSSPSATSPSSMVKPRSGSSPSFSEAIRYTTPGYDARLMSVCDG